MNQSDHYIKKHFDAFIKTPYHPQLPFNNISPYSWAKEVLEIERPSLKRYVVKRSDVRELCKPENDALDGYLTAMAWGAQEKGRSGKSNARKAWAQQDRIAANLKALQEQKLSRSEAYRLFHETNPVMGLGASYFTKLIYFFAPEVNGAADRYIMDKWTGISINLLTGKNLARLTRIKDKQSDSSDYILSQSNTAENYEVFCSEVDALTYKLNSLGTSNHRHSGENIEQMLFSLGSMPGVNGRTQREPWRTYVRENWEKERPTQRYSRKGLLEHWTFLKDSTI